MFDVAGLALRVDSQEPEKAAERLDRMADSAGRAESSADALEQAATRLGRAFVGLVTIERVAAAVGASVREFGRLETSLVAAQAAMGLAVSEFDTLRAAAAGLAQGSSFSAAEVGAAFDQIAQDAGTLAETPAQLEAITRSAITLAEATRSALPEAADALLQVLRQFGGGDALAFADVLASLGQSADELGDTTAAFRAVGSTAAQLGVGVEEVAAALQVLGAAGIEGAEAGTALKGVLLQLEEQGGTLAPSVAGLTEALEGVTDANTKWTDRSFAAGRILTANSAAVKANAASLKEGGVATRLAAANADTLAVSQKRLEAAVATLGAELGGVLAPGTAQATQAGADLLASITALITKTPSATSEFSLIAAAASKLAAILYGLAAGTIAVGEDIGGLAAVLAAAGTGNFAEAGRIWDDWMADREARAKNFETEFNRIWNGIQKTVADAPPLPGNNQTGPGGLDAGGAGILGGGGDGGDGNTRAPRFDAADAVDFLAEADIAVTEDPIAKLSQQMARELAAYADQGAKLVAAGVLAEDQRAQAVLARREANELALADATAEWQQQQAAGLLELAAQQAATDGEAASIRLEAEILRQYQRAIELGLGEEAAQQAALDARERGHAAIEKEEAEHAARLRGIEVKKWRDQVQGAITGGAAIVSLFASTNEKAFRIQKAGAVASTVLNMYQSASDAYRNALKDGGNPYVAAGLAAVAASAQLAQVVGVQNVSLGSGGAAPAAGGGASAPSAGSGLIREAGAGDAPTLDAIRASDRLPRFPAAGATINQKIEIINNAGAEVRTEAEQGPSGETLRVFIEAAVAQDIAQNGAIGQAIGRRYGVQPRLGVRA
jgi:hypothetical protein